jgi:hypothetical protein
MRKTGAGKTWTFCLETASSLLIGLILIHGLVASSFLVECVRADGSCQLRLVGHHPCPPHADDSCLHRQEPAILFWAAPPAHPCVDLNMDMLGIAHDDSVLAPPCNPDHSVRSHARPAISDPSPPPVLSLSFRLAREPVECPCGRNHSQTVLRI